MKAVQIKEFGIKGLVLNEVEKPVITDNQILIKVKAASLNYLDLLVVKGIFNNQLQLPHIPVTDVSGIIESVGKNVKKFKAGDEVISTFIPLWQKGNACFEQLAFNLRPSLGKQGYLAEYIAVDENDIVLKPANLSYQEASTLPIAALSAWNGIKYLNLFAGNTVLLYGTGGVSTFATLFSKANGYKVFVVGKDDENLQKMKSLGADIVLNLNTDKDWKESIMNQTNGKGVDGIYDSIGGDNLNNSLDVISFRGRITTVGLINGFTISLNAGTFLWKQAHLIGLECGSTEDLQTVINCISINKIKPVISKTYSLTQFKDAFEHLDKGGHFGKIVIEM
jgi:NADPH:quinone reductase-like Zn-dependent oxidoreductase